MPQSTVILVTLVVYMLVLLAIGLLAERRTRDEGDFFLGGRRIGPWVSAIGASASSSSAWTLLGVCGAAYGWGLSAIWLFPACVGGFCLNWFVLAPALQRVSHRSKAMTMIEVVAGPPGGVRRQAVVWLASVIVLVALGAYVASQFNGAGKVFSALFPIEPWQAIAIGAGVVLLYTLLGGFHAVSLTDALQGLMMALTAVVLPIAAFSAAGGLEGLRTLSDVPIDGYWTLAGPRTDVAALGFVLGVLGIGLGYPGQPHVLKYFMALRDERDAVRQARRVAIGWAVVIYAGMLLLGWSARVLHPDLADKEQAFVVAARDLFHPVVGGVMLAAVLSAMMSTADSQLLVASSTVTHDLGLGGHGVRSRLVRSRLTVLVLTVASAVIASVGSKEIFNQVLFGWAAMGAAFGPVLIVRVVLGRRLGPARALAAVATGFLLSVGAYYLHVPLFGEKDWWLFTRGVLPFAAALVVAGWPGRGRAATLPG